jgi:hypothetical protein
MPLQAQQQHVRASRRWCIGRECRGPVGQRKRLVAIPTIADSAQRPTQLLAIQDDDGTITLEEVVPLTRAELEHFTDPKSIEALQRAWDQADKGEARPFTPTN